MAFQYVDKDTVIHRLNPISKIILILLFMIDAIIFRDIVSMLILVSILMVFVIAARLPLGYLKGTIIKFLTAMVLILVISQGFWYYGGQYVIFTIPGFENNPAGQMTLDGLFFGAAMSLKIVIVVLCMPLLTMTTAVNKFMAALNKMKVPYTFVFALTTAFKFTPLVADSFTEIKEAQMMRGLDFDNMKFFKKIKAYVSLSTPLVLSLVRKTDEMDVAIEARAFGSDIPRTFLVEVKFHARDFLVVIFAISFFAVCLWAFLTWGHLIPGEYIPLIMRTR
ncbi:MAG: energy-coupling factor transporter transmembrane component T family protein [Candidatus Ranarchaeia archaeon]